MNIIGRIQRIEDALAPQGADDGEITKWAELFAGAGVTEPEKATRDFVTSCQAIGEQPSIMALHRLALRKGARNEH